MDSQMEIRIPHVSIVHQGQARKTMVSIRVTFIITRTKYLTRSNLKEEGSSGLTCPS